MFTTRKLSLNDNFFQDSAFDDISDIGITQLFMNIMYCHEFLKEYKTTVILTHCIKLLTYYISKRFLF